MNRREFCLRLAGVSAVVAYTGASSAISPAWIQKHQRVLIHGLQPGESQVTVVSFKAGAGDYAVVSGNADLYGLLVAGAIDANGDVVITTYNPGTQPVSASLELTIRLYKM